MIRSVLVIAAIAASSYFSATVADEKPAAGKEVQLKGALVCAKCKLKLDGIKKCTNALVVKENGKDVTYLLRAWNSLAPQPFTTADPRRRR